MRLDKAERGKSCCCPMAAVLKRSAEPATTGVSGEDKMV